MATTSPLLPAIRTVGFWLAVVMAALQGLNAFRSFSDPVGFAAYMGLPLASVADTPFVAIYGLRAAFIALLVVLFLAQARFSALSWMALVAVVMPIGDAGLAAQADAPAATVTRHAVIAAYLVLAFVMLRRTARHAS